MTGVLPDFTSPNVTLQVNGITYYYVMSKDPAEDVKVYVRNEDAVNGGYIFEEVDEWSGLPGNSIQKNFRFPPQSFAMAPELLARKKEFEACLRHFMQTRELSEIYAGWRGDVVGKPFLEILETAG